MEAWSLTLWGSAILTVFQIQDMENDPLTHMAALCSLVSALMSLSLKLYTSCTSTTCTACTMHPAGPRYISPPTFPSAPTHLCQQEAQKTKMAIFWNVWVLLALPGIWLTWSVLAFIVTIMSFCYVTVGMFAQRGLSSTAKTLRSLSGVWGSEC